jgi:hypothetical protein
MKCSIKSFVIAAHPFGQGEATSICETHHWQFGNLPVGPDTVCPIGRIEEARDNAIEEIRMAKDAL